MRYSNYPFTLDVHKTLSQVSIPVTLGDTARQLFIGLTDGGKPYIIPDGCRATLSACKADGNCLLHDCIIEKNTTIRYDFTDQTATAPGKMDCTILLYGTNGRLITSPRFTMVVYADIVGYDALSETDLQSIGRMLAAEEERVIAENARAEAEAARAERVNEALTALDTAEIIKEVLRVAKETEAFEATEFATDAEVIKILDKVYGDNPDNIPEDDLITEDDLATDEEVLSMLNGVFGSN